MAAEAEALNAEGNTAFNAGDFVKAKELYFKAVQTDGKVAKYRTNLCNALLRSGDPGMAVEEAAAAIAVDGTWVKGYYFKALALEELGDTAWALATCEEGLHIHRCGLGQADVDWACAVTTGCCVSCLCRG
jgi:tetratricopeptide (TPR) repeat protein